MLYRLVDIRPSTVSPKTAGNIDGETSKCSRYTNDAFVTKIMSTLIDRPIPKA